jgi:hypothetical protein
LGADGASAAIDNGVESISSNGEKTKTRTSMAGFL